MEPQTPRWRQLMVLLGPIHDDARLLARRIARSSADGDDLFHEAVLRALDKLGALRDPARFRPWFYRVLFSVHRSRGRRGFWRRLVSLDGAEAAAEVAAEAGDALPAGAGDAHRAARALATLPPAQREAIVLYELQGHTVEEVAALQGASISAVKSRLSRARERLRKFYRRLGIAPAAKEESRAYSNASL